MVRLPTKKVAYGMMAAQAVLVVVDHLRRLEIEDRDEALRILRESRGLPNRMSDRERRRLVEIAAKIDRRQLLADLSPLASPGGRRRPL